jgi:exonuclease III
MERLRIASWNVAGGKTINSLKRFDFASTDIGYFTNELKQARPDIICLQEIHTKDGEVQAQIFAEQLGMPYVFNTANSPSHIDPDYQLGNAILSRHAFTVAQDTKFPNPSFELRWKDGSLAPDHPKGLQTVDIGDLTIANTQLLPVDIWDYNYRVGCGAELASDIEEIVIDSINHPVIVGGDFNYNHPKEIFPHLYQVYNLAESLPNEITRPTESGEMKTPDHILYSISNFQVIQSEIIPTNTDHYLCIVDFAVI